MQFGRVLLLLPALFLHVENAGAMNWEGHDAWFHDTTPFQEFYDGIPGPKVKPLPVCDDVTARHKANVYEQTALPGVNCVETAAPGSKTPS